MTAGAELPPSGKSLAATLARVEGTEASGRFVSGLLAQMWDHAKVAVSNTIKDALEPVLADLEPAALHLVRLDLGDVPIRTRNMFIRRVDMGRAGNKGKRAGVQVDVDVDWDGNCDVTLQANLTRSAKFTFGVRSVKLSGRMHVLLGPLTTELPVISAVQYSFMNPPSIRMEFTGAVHSLTGKFSAIQSALISAIRSALASALVLPQRAVVPVDPGGYDYLEAYHPPVGMVRVTAVGGRGFQVQRRRRLRKDTPDVYCLISLGASGVTGPKFRTSTRVDDLTPSWNESCDFILYDMDQKVYLQAMDKDKDRDDELGKAEISVRDLFGNDREGAAELELEMGEGEKTSHRVTLSVELFHLSKRLESFSSPTYEKTDHLCGLVTIIVTRAFDVPVRREAASTFVKVVYGKGTKHEKIFYTGTVTDYSGIDALNPTFDCAFHVPVSAAMLQRDRRSSRILGMANRAKGDRDNEGGANDIIFIMMDGEGADGAKGRGEMGTITVRHEELQNTPGNTITETRLIGDGGARLEFRVVMNGMQSEEEKLQEIRTSFPVNAVADAKNVESNASLDDEGDPSSCAPLHSCCGLWEPVSTFLNESDSFVATSDGVANNGGEDVSALRPPLTPASPRPYHTINLDVASNGDVPSTNSVSSRSNRVGVEMSRECAPLSQKNSFAATLAHIEGVEASGNFLSGILAHMWNHSTVAVSNAIKDELEPMLKDLQPVSLNFVRLDLGDVPIRVKNMFIHRVVLEQEDSKEKRTGIQIDVDVEWDGNCDIMLQANLTKSVKVAFGVKSIKLSGRMHVLLSPLTTTLPVVSAVQCGFTNPPSIRLEFTGDVQGLANFSVVQSALVSAIQSALADAVVLPQRMLAPVDLASYDYLETYHPPVGMIRVTVVEGSGFKVLQKFFVQDVPDVYCLISLGASSSTGSEFCTSTKYDDLNPSWKDESFDFILYDMDQKVYLQVMDKDQSPFDPDDELGKAEVSVRDLFRNDRGGVAELGLQLEGREETSCRITLSAELFHISEQLGSFSSPIYGGENQLCGLITIIVTKAFDIPIPREDAAIFIKVAYCEGTRHEKIFYTGTVTDCPGIDALNPVFDSAFHVPVSAAMLQQEKTSSPELYANGANDIVFTLTDSSGTNGLKDHGELGTMTVSHEELLNAYRHTITETRLIGNGGARLEFRVIMSGLQSEEEKLRENSSPQSNDVSSSLSLVAPKSLYGGAEEPLRIRITAVRGRGFMIKKRRLGRRDDVPDVYCNIRLASSRGKGDGWKTRTIKDDTMPQWNESRDFDCVNPVREVVLVNVHEENSKGKDEHLGAVEFSVEKLLRKRLLEVELQDGSAPTKMYVTFMCIQLGAASSPEEENNNAVAPLPPTPVRVVLENDSLNISRTNSTSSRSSRARASRMVKKLRNKISIKKKRRW